MSQTAIEYGAARLRLLEFEGAGRKLRVLAVRDVDLEVPDVGPDEEGEDEAADVRAERIDEAVRDGGFPTDPSAMSFDSAHAIFREFDLPFTNDEQIRKVVRFESESHIPFDIDDVIVQHVVLRKTRDKSRILVVAVKKDDLLDRLDILDAAHLDPIHVDVDVFALQRALVGTGVADEHERFALVHASERSTTLLFLEGGKPFAVRSIRIGTHTVTHGHDVDDHEGGTRVDHEIEAARTRDYLTRLTREIRRTRTTLPPMEELEAVYVTGSGARLPGVVEAVGEVLGRPAEELDLLARVEHRLDEDDARHHGPDVAVALGMAFKLSGLDLTDTEFRREEAAYKRKFDQVVASLIVVSFLVLLLTAFLALDAFLEVRKLRNEYAIMTDYATDQLEIVVGEADPVQARLGRFPAGPDRLRAAVDFAEDTKEDIERQLGRSSIIPPQQSALTAWIQLFTTLKQHQVAVGKFFLERLDISVGKRPTIKLDGQVEDNERYQTLLDTLAGVPMFTAVVPGGTKQLSNAVRFSDLTIELDPEMLVSREEGRP